MRYCSYLRQYGGLVFLLTAYIILALLYSYVIPFSKGPDEYIHYRYIFFLTKHSRLPANLSERQEAGVRSDWPPLYQYAASLMARPVPLTSPPDLKVTWEPATRQLIDIVLPRATLVRTEDERPPYRGVYAVWQIGRWVSLALGAGTLVFTYFIGLTLWPKEPTVATGATVLLVFAPRFLFTHAVLSDDTMLGFWLALYLLIWVRLLRRLQDADRHVTVGGYYRYFIGLGATAGLAIVSKYTAIPVVAGALITGSLVARWQRWSWSTMWRDGVAFAGSLILTAGWWVGWIWWHFNQIDTVGLVMGLVKPLLPGSGVDDNPTITRLNAFLTGQSGLMSDEVTNASSTFFDWARHSFITFWGVTVFGAEPQWPHPYAAILVIMALFSLVAVIGLWRVYRLSVGAERLIWQAFTIHVLLFLPIPLLRFALSRRLNDAAQGRHLLFPAGPALVMMLMAGWLSWFRPHWRERVALTTGGVMLAWSIAHLFYLWTAYPPPLPVRTTPGPQMQVEESTQVNFGDTLLLTGYQTELDENGSVLKLDLLWQSLAQAWEDYRTEITLLDQQGQPQLRWVSQPADGRFPVRAWQPGDVVRDTLHIPLVGLTPGAYQLQLRLLGWDEPFPSKAGEAVFLTSLELDPLEFYNEVEIWQQGQTVNRRAAPYYYRSTIPITAPLTQKISLVGPDGQTRLPTTELGQLLTFMVDHDWPSGEYQVQVDGQANGLSLSVENFDSRGQGWNFNTPEMMYPVQANFADKIALLGYDLPTRRVEAGSGIPLVLYWQGLAQMRNDYTVFVQLLDANLEQWGGYDRYPREYYNTYLWVPGEVVADGFAVPVEADAPDGVYTIRIGWYREEDGQAVPLPLVLDGQPSDQTSVVIGPIKIGGPPPGVGVERAIPEYALNIALGDTIALRGYDLGRDDRRLRLKLYWQSLDQTDTNYTVFVHLRNEAGETVAQMDKPPVDGKYPTSLWDIDEIVPDTFALTLPPNLEPETYRLVVGMYDPRTGVRLVLPGTMDDSILLTEISLR